MGERWGKKKENERTCTFNGPENGVHADSFEPNHSRIAIGDEQNKTKKKKKTAKYRLYYRGKTLYSLCVFSVRL
jgi:hypothetical protein